MTRLALIALFVPTFAVGGEDAKVLDVKCRDIGKKLTASLRLTEFGLKPFQQAPDAVRTHFFKLYAEIPFSADNRAFFCSVVAKKDPQEEVRLGAISWLGRLAGNKLALKTLGDLMTDKKPAVRLAVLQALASHKDPTIGPRLGKLLLDADKDIRTAAIRAVGALGDRQQVPALLQSYKKFGQGDETDIIYGEPLAILGETKASLEIARSAIKSKLQPVRLAAVRALELNPSMQVIPVIMENLILELRRCLTLDSTKMNWDVVYVTMCTELQRRTGQAFGNDVVRWYDWWEGVRVQYMASAPLFERATATRWLETYRKLNPSKVKE